MSTPARAATACFWLTIAVILVTDLRLVVTHVVTTCGGLDSAGYVGFGTAAAVGASDAVRADRARAAVSQRHGRGRAARLRCRGPALFHLAAVSSRPAAGDGGHAGGRRGALDHLSCPRARHRDGVAGFSPGSPHHRSRNGGARRGDDRHHAELRGPGAAADERRAGRVLGGADGIVALASASARDLGALAAGMAILTRPPLLLAALALGATTTWETRRQAVTFATIVAATTVLFLALQRHIYGNAFVSGYGTAGQLFTLAALGHNLRFYGGWLLVICTPVLPPLFAIGAAAEPRLALRAGAVFLAVSAPYLIYAPPFEDWEILRFLLPGLPFVFVVCARGIVAIGRVGDRPAGAYVAATITAIVLAGVIVRVSAAPACLRPLCAGAAIPTGRRVVRRPHAAARGRDLGDPQRQLADLGTANGASGAAAGWLAGRDGRRPGTRRLRPVRRARRRRGGRGVRFDGSTRSRTPRSTSSPKGAFAACPSSAHTEAGRPLTARPPSGVSRAGGAG